MYFNAITFKRYLSKECIFVISHTLCHTKNSYAFRLFMSFMDFVVTKVSSRETQERCNKQCERWAAGWRELWVAEGSLPTSFVRQQWAEGGTDWRARELPHQCGGATNNNSGESCNSLEFSTFSVLLPERWGSSNALGQTVLPGHGVTSVPATPALSLHCAVPSHRHSQGGARCGCQTGQNMPSQPMQVDVVYVLSAGHVVTSISYNKSPI